MPSPNLAIAHVAAAQNQKEVTINDAVDALDLAMTEALAVDCSAGGTITVAAVALRRHVSLVLTGAPAAAFTLQLAAVPRLLYLQNTTGREVTVTSAAGGATVTIVAGQRLMIYSNGSAVLPVEAALGASGVTPGSYGDGGHVPRLTVDAQGRITHATTLPLTGGGEGGGGEGGGGAPLWFGGATGNVAGSSTTAYATKGIFSTPDRQLLVSHLSAYIAATATGQDHHALIAEVTGRTTADTISAVLAVSATVPSTALELRLIRFPFASPVVLDVGKTYLLATVNASGTGTTVNRTGNIASSSNTAWDLDAPAETFWGAAQFPTIGLTPGQSPAVIGSGKYSIMLEGSML